MQNPIGITNIGDPFILLYEGIYYLYATSFANGFYVWKSEDLEHWSEPAICYRMGERSFGYQNFWAPEVVYHNGKFLMHYTACWKGQDSLRIGVAWADSPEGPFVDILDKKPMFDFGYAAIDGHVFRDEDGKNYLYYSRDCSEQVVEGYHESHIYVVELNEELTEVKGEGRCLLKPDQAWEYKEGENFRWNEGPFVIKKDGWYYLMYSANFYASKEYSVGYAKSKSPLGPFEKASENPVLSHVEGVVSGPGHNCLFKAKDGEWYCAYHVHSDVKFPDGNRQVCIDRVKVKEGRLSVEGPTWSAEKEKQIIPRGEYPRPQFVRERWVNLNGWWEFSFDSAVFDKKIRVPYPYQAELSGIGLDEAHDKVWYRRSFAWRSEWSGRRVLLHFGAVDYACHIRINGLKIGSHEGGHVSFEFDITQYLNHEDNILEVEVYDPVSDLCIPRGKQSTRESFSIFYTRTTGIWQSVWLEDVPNTYIRQVFVTPDVDRKSVEFSYEIEGEHADTLRTEITFCGKKMADISTELIERNGEFTLGLDQRILNRWNYQEDMLWSPENPRLFQVVYSLIRNNQILDRVESYFGMRKISVENGCVFLNNRRYVQKLVLDQGYWSDSLLTAPSDSALTYDIAMVKAMGFNGVRKHQKIEDPRFLYHADQMGILVWEEMPSAYVFSRGGVRRSMNEWTEAVLRDYNHPSIVAWTPLNESWGIAEIKDSPEQQSYSEAMVALTKALDKTRLVISNDGWEHTASDLLTIHDYESNPELLNERYSSLEQIFSFFPAGKPLYAKNYSYEGQPILVTEYGGVSCGREEGKDWGYSNAKNQEEFLKSFCQITEAIGKRPLVQGICYTQLTDVEQEKNGLLTYEREPKVAPARIREILDNL